MIPSHYGNSLSFTISPHSLCVDKHVLKCLQNRLLHLRNLDCIMFLTFSVKAMPWRWPDPWMSFLSKLFLKIHAVPSVLCCLFRSRYLQQVNTNDSIAPLRREPSHACAHACLWVTSQTGSLAVEIRHLARSNHFQSISMNKNVVIIFNRIWNNSQNCHTDDICLNVYYFFLSVRVWTLETYAWACACASVCTRLTRDISAVHPNVSYAALPQYSGFVALKVVLNRPRRLSLSICHRRLHHSVTAF